jgi:hypothetical protein
MGRQSKYIDKWLKWWFHMKKVHLSNMTDISVWSKNLRTHFDNVPAIAWFHADEISTRMKIFIQSSTVVGVSIIIFFLLSHLTFWMITFRLKKSDGKSLMFSLSSCYWYCYCYCCCWRFSFGFKGYMFFAAAGLFFSFLLLLYTATGLILL